MNNQKAAVKRLNILTLDGGGVRGISSLLILKALMVQINQALVSLGATTSDLPPQQFFQLAGGTSTGGLIALMLSKMELTVDECIARYEEFSRVVFGKKHLKGKITLGLASPRYSGERLRDCIRGLLSDRQLDKDLSIRSEADVMACCVICREHSTSSKYSALKARAVPICSLPCNINIICKVCDAARATSAAPTFFPAANIEGRLFVDGGLQHNNASFSTYYHYSRNKRLASTKRTAASTSVPLFSPHGDIGFSSVRITNIGTGSKVNEVEPRKREWLAGLLLPSAIRQSRFLKKTLTEIAVDPEGIADMMRTFQYLNPDAVMFERFSANHGVSNIKLDAYNALPDIRERTERYLEEQDTKVLLQEVGLAIATDYLNNQMGAARNTQAVDSAIGESHQRMDALQLTPGFSLLSSGPSSHNGHQENKYQGLLPNHNEIENGGQTPLTKDPPENLLLPHGQWHSQHDAQEDSGIDTAGPEI